MKLFKKKRATKNSAAYDIPVLNSGVVEPGGTYVFDTDASFKIADDECALIIARSSLGFKKNLMLVNNVGLIDSDYYPNEVKIKVYNFGTEPVTIEKGERIAQALIIKYETLDGEELTDFIRDGGFGSTGRL